MVSWHHPDERHTPAHAPNTRPRRPHGASDAAAARAQAGEGQGANQGTIAKRPSPKAGSGGSGTIQRRAAARRPTGGSSRQSGGQGSGGILRFYTDDAPGLKMCATLLFLFCVQCSSCTVLAVAAPCLASPAAARLRVCAAHAAGCSGAVSDSRCDPQGCLLHPERLHPRLCGHAAPTSVHSRPWLSGGTYDHARAALRSTALC